MFEQHTSIEEKVALRPVTMPDDEAFLCELYFSSRDDLAGIVADDAQLRQMLMIQYMGQKQTYSQQYPKADHDIILLDGESVGRLMIERRPEEIFGVDLLLLPESRARGIGTVVLKRLFAESSHRGVPFRFSVVKENPAIRLYERLGCRTAGDTATHLFMIWDGSTES